MRIERCENCEYYSSLECELEKGEGFKKSHCCLYFVLMERERYVVEVWPNDRCEVFRRRVDNG